MEKELKEKESRWFLMKHTCGGQFTITSDIFRQKSDESDDALRCPNCFGELSKNTIRSFFDNYHVSEKKLNCEGITIREMTDSHDIIQSFLSLLRMMGK